MAEECISPYEIVCKMNENNRYIKECENAMETIEQIGHLLFRLENNDAIRDLDISDDLHEGYKRLQDAIRKVSRAKAEHQVDNGHLHWSLKFVVEKPAKKTAKRGRPKKTEEVA